MAWGAGGTHERDRWEPACGLLCCEVSAEHTKAQSHVGPTVTGLVGDTGVKRDGVLSRGVAAMGEAGLGVTTTP